MVGFEQECRGDDEGEVVDAFGVGFVVASSHLGDDAIQEDGQCTSCRKNGFVARVVVHSGGEEQGRLVDRLDVPRKESWFIEKIEEKVGK